MMTAVKSDHIGLLDNGGCVVIVGGKARNFTDEYREHPRVVYWDSDDPRIKSKELPTNARVVITIPKFISHVASDSIIRQARQRNLVLMPLNGTNEIKKTLDRMLAEVPKEMPKKGVVLRHHSAEPVKPVERPAAPTTPVAASTPVLMKTDLEPPKAKKGTLRDFVRQHLTMEGTHSAEATRLHALATKEGIKSTVGSITTLVGQLRRERGMRVRPAKPVTEVVTTPAPPPAAVVEEPEVKSDTLTLVDDLIAGLQLVREAVVKDAAENQRLRDRLSALRNLVKEI